MTILALEPRLPGELKDCKFPKIELLLPFLWNLEVEPSALSDKQV
jgi:hypothetical protein